VHFDARGDTQHHKPLAYRRKNIPGRTITAGKQQQIHAFIGSKRRRPLRIHGIAGPLRSIEYLRDRTRLAKQRGAHVFIGRVPDQGRRELRKLRQRGAHTLSNNRPGTQLQGACGKITVGTFEARGATDTRDGIHNKCDA
jgi:hypothetical protein